MTNTLQKLPQISQNGQQQQQQQIEQFTCEICIEPTSNQFKNGDKCSHAFCTDCMIKYIRVKLDDDNVDHISCPALNCDHSLDPRACAPLIGSNLFVRWCDVLCESAIVDCRNKCYCPYRECHELILNECGENPKKSICPNCKRLFCFQCECIWHAGFGCEENVRDVNDVAFGVLAERMRWVRCPYPMCRRFVEKVAGCQYVRCRCGIKFCYKCGKQLLNILCHCDKSVMCCEYCCRIFVFLIPLSLIFLFFHWYFS